VEKKRNSKGQGRLNWFLLIHSYYFLAAVYS
jgi:hypothetical protein